MPQKFLNNYRTTVAAQLAVAGLSLTVADATALGVVTPTDFAKLTLVRRSGNEETAWEIVKVTGRSGNVLTIERAQEGTTALQWEVGELVSARWTAAAAASVISPFTKEYVSAPIGYPAAQGTALPHGFNSLPKLVQVEIECIQADGGYAPGDRVILNTTGETNSTVIKGIGVRVDNVNIRLYQANWGIAIVDTNGNVLEMSNGRWNLIVRAWA